jgi:SAM-dependent methyltransferase
MNESLIALQNSYDGVAEEYVARIFHELEHKPLDRELLDRFAAKVRGSGPVCDLGCGPGHVARYLFERGVNVFGLDLSPRMVEQAQRLNPDIVFKQGNMLAMDVDDEAWAGIVAFYSSIHIPRDNMIAALQELKRVLRPQGLLLLAFHVGQETLHREELWGKKVSLDFLFFERQEVEEYLKSAGFVIEDIVERPPYENVEYPSHRAYIFARKP